jgi:hypothetical protein
MASPVRAQTAPGAGEPAAPPPAVEAPLPETPSSTGRAPAAAAEPAAPPSGQTPAAPAPPSSGHTAAAPPQRPLARHRDSAATVSAKVNLRGGPDTDSEILTTIPAGAAVRVGECDGEWCKVIWSGHSGYAIARNLNLGGQRQDPGGQRQAGLYSGEGRPGKPGGPGPGPGYQGDYDSPGYGPGYYGPPVVYGGPAYYYGPRVYYYPRPWGWRRYWW